ncbi:MAG: MATE family efflux transporter [Lachnospirales bacterium]
MNILAKDFNVKSLIQYVLPTILMMIFMSTYSIIDGLFVANLVGEDALSAVNIVMPIANILYAIGLMFATGGTAVMGKLMGEGKSNEARSFLSILYIVAIALGLIITIIILNFPNEIVAFLGVNDELYSYAMEYLIPVSYFSIAIFLQIFAQTFFVLAGKPILGFVVCFLGGVTNIVLDYIFISPNMLNLGIAGAGLATGLGYCVPAVFALVYFTFFRKGDLYFAKPVMKINTLLQSMFNGMSELVSQLSVAVTTLLFNMILLELVGTSGVASISVILYIQMIQTAIYFGYATGVAPIISYKYGAGDIKGLEDVVNISFKFIAIVSALVIAFSLLFGDFAVGIFIKKSSDTFAMATQGLKLFSVAYLFMGVNLFMSAMFTALSNGKVSVILSFSRTFVFLIGSLLILPYFLHLNGVWLAVPLAEFLAFLLSIYLFKKGRKKYGF